MSLLSEKGQHVSLQTLGGLSLEDSTFARPKPLLLLAYLSLEGPKDKRFLAELFFPESEDRSGSLRQTLSRLRRVGEGVVESDAQRMWTPLVSDAAAFLGVLEARELEKATALYRGSFLTGTTLPELGVELEEWVYATREFLAGALRGALLTLAEEAAGLGDVQTATRYAERAYQLEGAAELEPEAFAPLHALLVAGGSPYAAALKREAEGYNLTLSTPKRAVLEEAGAPLSDRDIQRPTAHLPKPLTQLIGRTAELAELKRLLTDPEVRMLSLLGPGGVGKTRLAVELAHLQASTFADGAHFIALDLLETPERLPERLARTFGLELERAEEAEAELESFLRAKKLLLLLDGAETVVGLGPWLSKLLGTSLGFKLLLTTRERFGLAEEWVFPLEGLAVPPPGTPLPEALTYDAVTLFVQRAKRANLRFEATPENLPDIIRLCTLVQGFPLGLALASVWVKLLPIRDIADEVARNIDVLSAGGSGYSERHRSIRAVFESSWNRLSPSERAALRKLSIFHGGFRRAAATAVAGSSLPVLARLVDASLLRVLSAGRYDRHPLLYQLMREKLAEEPAEEAAVREAHARFFLSLAEEAEPKLITAEQRLWLDGLEAEHDNLRAALAWCLEDAGRLGEGFRFAHALYTFWARRAHVSEARAWLAQLLNRPGVPPTRARANALERAGSLAWLQGDYSDARSYLKGAILLARQLGDGVCLAAALGTLGGCEVEEGHYDTGKGYFEESLALSEELGDVQGMARIQHNLGTLAHDQGDLATAQMRFEESLALFRSLGAQHHVAWTLNSLAGTALEKDDMARTQAYAEEAALLLGASGDPIARGFSQHYLAATAAARGEYGAAHKHHLESVRLQHKAGNKHGLLSALEGLAAFLLPDHAAQAVRLSSAVDNARSSLGIPRTPLEERHHSERLTEARFALSDEAFEMAWRVGRHMGLEEAVTEVVPL